MLFGKNSDRQRNEPQNVEYLPQVDNGSDRQLTCTYITIPQVQHTHAVLLCRPFWIWGAEMGANECGVVIGNEAVHARGPAPEEKALTGMDLLRVALERSTTASEAVNVITTLLERFGQGGNCGHLTPHFYCNSFLIVDETDSFVLETVGREWLVERVRSIRAISNGYSIRHHAERTSAGLRGLLSKCGWMDSGSEDYADAIGDPQLERRAQAVARRERSSSLLRAREGKLKVADIMRILRDHGADDQQNEWNPRTSSARTLCMHAGTDERPGQTTGSMVSEVRTKDPVHWVTGTAATCISIFKPLLLNVPVPPHGPSPTDRFDPRTLWWRHELVHRAALLGDFPRFIEGVRQERDTLEAEFNARVAVVLNGGTRTECAHVVNGCWKDAIALEDHWLDRVRAMSAPCDTSFDAAWSRMNRLASMDDGLS